MLQFIFGKPASGKTYTVLEKIKQLDLKGEKSILIVPEQFTFESERAVLKTLGDKAALNTQVLSFTRLCDEVGRKTGGIAGRLLGDCDKVVFMKRALALVEDELKLWKHHTGSVSFSKTMLDSIGEFKINAITPQELRKTAEATEKATLKLKLTDIALIYETYDAVTGEKFIDPADSLTNLYRALSDYRYFEGKNVFIDSFKGFTGQQYKILERIISQAENVYISFTNVVENNSEFNVYTNIRSSAEQIKRIAKTYNVKVNEPLILGECRYVNKGLSDLEALISGKSDTQIANDGSVNICCAATPMDEAEFSARTIRRLVREEGYRYRDFVIIARNAEQYNDLVLSACKKNDINLFYDNRIPLSSFPLAVAGESAINALSLFSENILRFHKTGLGTLNTDEISILENYVFLWNIEGELWLQEWDMNPYGLTADSDRNGDCEEKLAEINRLRERAIKPIITFRKSFKGKAADMAEALVHLFEECNVSKKLSEMCECFKGENENFLCDVLKQSYEEYMKILDSLVSCFGDRTIDCSEFSETLSIAVSLADVGVIPQTLDQVTFGAADRIRPSRPRVAFVLGANQGVFPKTVANSGVFNISERKYLIEQGINFADNSVYSSIEEEYLVYCNLCCPSEKLYVSFYEQSVAGEKAEPSTFLSVIKKNLDSDIFYEPQTSLSPINAPETENAALGEFCRRIRKDISAAVSLKYALNDSSVKGKLDYIESCAEDKPKAISPDIAKELFGENIRMSASRFDSFNRCHFSYFCRYGLKAQKLQPADFDVMQRGTIVHFVLEKLITEQKDVLEKLSGYDLDLLTERYIGEYLDSIAGFRSVLNARTEFLISRITRSLKEVVRHIAEELAQSDFKPVACELKIGENSPLCFRYNSGKIYLNGSIDRVDKYKGYIRIIDYKTGSKSFKLPDILFGLNLQMLIYLYAVTRASGLDDAAAAGILYQPSKRNINDNNMAMNGLLQSNTELYSAMDKTGNGEFVPILSFNNDGSLSKRCASYIEKEGFTAIFDYIEKLMKKTGNTIASGDICISPLDGRESPACKYCEFASVCGIENREVPRVPDLKNDEVFEFIREAENNGI